MGREKLSLSKPSFGLALCSRAGLALLSLPVLAGTAFGESPDNGTDPTKLRRQAAVSYEYLDLGRSVSRGTMKLLFETPISKSASIRVTLPFQSFNVGPYADDMALGDISLRMTQILSLNRKGGIVGQFEVTADTATREDIGSGTTVLKGGVVFANFLEGGHIFAPAIAHSESVGGGNRVRESVLDFYYVPKLTDPAWYTTFDPAIIRNWESGTTYGSLAVTVGRSIGTVGDGLVQAYVKPSMFVGGDRPSDWGVEVGIRAIGF